MADDGPTHVVDANIVLAWSLERPYSRVALELRGSGHRLIAPDLVVAEAGSALSWYVKNAVLTLEQAHDALSTITTFVPLVSAAELRREALRLSVETGHPIYDCFYPALALLVSRPLVSADAKLLALANRISIETIAFD